MDRGSRKAKIFPFTSVLELNPELFSPSGSNVSPRSVDFIPSCSKSTHRKRSSDFKGGEKI